MPRRKLAKNARNLVRETGRGRSQTACGWRAGTTRIADRYDPAACMWHRQAPLAGGDFHPLEWGGGGRLLGGDSYDPTHSLWYQALARSRAARIVWVVWGGGGRGRGGHRSELAITGYYCGYYRLLLNTACSTHISCCIACYRSWRKYLNKQRYSGSLRVGTKQLFYDFREDENFQDFVDLCENSKTNEKNKILLLYFEK